MTAQEALKRQRQLEEHARANPMPTARTEELYPSISATEAEMPSISTIGPVSSPSLSIIEASLPVAKTKEVVMPSATARPMESVVIESVTPGELPVESATSGSIGPSTGSQIGDTLEMIKASKMYADPSIRRQVDQIESQSQKVDSYAPVGDYLKKKRGGQ